MPRLAAFADRDHGDDPPATGSVHARPNFGVAALLYLVTEELLVEADEDPGGNYL